MSGCPEGMYPMDSKYENEVDSLEELIEQAEQGSDVLNFPISWYVTLNEDEDEPNKFEVVFLMPRKYGDTWSLYTHEFDPDAAVEWVKVFTYKAAGDWYGWEEDIDIHSPA